MSRKKLNKISGIGTKIGLVKDALGLSLKKTGEATGMTGREKDAVEGV